MTFVPRESYNMPGPLGRPMKLPSRGLWLHHSATTPTSDPDRDARRIAEIGIERFGRASYSFLIHPQVPQRIYEMQGHHIGVHTRRQNSTSHGVVIVGNYENLKPSGELLNTISHLIAYGENQGWWTRKELLGGHRDNPYSSTACPGRNLYSQLSTINNKARSITMGQPDSWAREAWDWGKQNGLVNDQTEPKDPVNKQEMIVFLHRYHNNADKTGSGGGDHNHDGRYVKSVREIK